MLFIEFRQAEFVFVRFFFGLRFNDVCKRVLGGLFGFPKIPHAQFPGLHNALFDKQLFFGELIGAVADDAVVKLKGNLKIAFRRELADTGPYVHRID